MRVGVLYLLVYHYQYVSACECVSAIVYVHVYVDANICTWELLFSLREITLAQTFGVILLIAFIPSFPLRTMNIILVFLLTILDNNYDLSVIYSVKCFI